MSTVLEVLVAFLVVAGATVTLLGAIGLVRFPDFFTRMHGPSKTATLGLGCMLLAALLHFAVRGAVSFHGVAFVLFIVLTTPVSAHLLARAARHRGLPEASTGARVPGPNTGDAPQQAVHANGDSARRVPPEN